MIVREGDIIGVRRSKNDYLVFVDGVLVVPLPKTMSSLFACFISSQTLPTPIANTFLTIGMLSI